MDDVGKAARIAAEYVDVVTTSGPGTGQAADRDKIQAMKEVLGSNPLAIASGITAQNIGDYYGFSGLFSSVHGDKQGAVRVERRVVESLA